MGFIKNFKRDFAQAVNELLPESDEKPKKNNDIVGKCCHSVEDYSSQKVFEHYLNLYTSISR